MTSPAPTTPLTSAQSSSEPVGGTSATGSAAPQTTVSAGASPLPTVSAIHTAYSDWLTDISGLDDNFAQSWVPKIAAVATPNLVRAAQAAASSIMNAHDHGVGTLVDSAFSVAVHGSSATVTDCLDEIDWYVVEDASGKPDPSVTRGDFVGAATLTLSHGHWYVSLWQSETTRCTY